MEPLRDSKGRSVVPCIINNTELPIDDATIVPVHSALSDEPVHYYQAADEDICKKACTAAWDAFDGGWKRASILTRRNLLLKVATLYEENVEKLVESQVLETSCPEPWARNNVVLAVSYMREIAACISGVHGTIPPTEKPDTMTFVFKEAVGPILVIPPWNAALVLSSRAVASAIGAGCTVVLKASEQCPLTHASIVDIYRKAGSPPGVINSLQASREAAASMTEALIADERIRKIEFIGSAAVGRQIGATAAKYLKPVLMELGGKGPAIVLDDANIQKAAVLCAKGALLHHGQICFSTERVIVQRKVANDFIEKLVKVVESTPGGTAVSERIAQTGLDILQDAKDKGAVFLTGGPELVSRNAVKPSLVQIDPETTADQMRIIDEETFAPSASVYIVNSDEQAVALANRSVYGLNATIHTTNMERAINMGRNLEYGQVHINSISVYVSPTGPQGGVKGSGWGRQNASWGLDEYFVERHISWHGEGSSG
ncbi:hypothetical protein AAFC00_001989 [Neodothiora populina]|uniref:Aldehyde dehydrogenase domain-containing protein n=1 Tax=Neodothiora populina TaxID=2781224 RepID=A0ABR3PGE2_9PEZI